MNPLHTLEFISENNPTYRVHRLSERQLIRLENYLASRGIQQMMGPARGVDEKDTPYITLMAGGPQVPEEDLPTIQADMDEEAQITHFTIGLDSWLGDRKMIVWRIRPMVHAWEDEDGRQCSTIRCRLTAYATPAEAL